MTRIETLAKFLECDVSELKEGYKEGVFETEDGEEYLVLTDEEADEEFYDYERTLIEDVGFNAFTDWAKDYIMENCINTEWFDDCMYENYEMYCNDIENEAASDCEYENRLQEEMAQNMCETKEDYIEFLCNNEDDSISWYRFNFGEDSFNYVVDRNNLFNMDEVIEFIKESDGRSCLAPYDGTEHEYDGYYIYRLN